MAIKFRLLRADEIELRVGMQNPKGASLLLYKDSRCDMAILDEEVGPENWQRSHTRDNANCVLSIWDEGKKQWISKEDTGTASRTEAEKGLASDSFKRAGVNWGIGRELYSAPFVWVPIDKLPTRVKNGKQEVMADHLHVANIRYDEERRRITELSIANSDTAEVIFTWSKAITSATLPAGALDINDGYTRAATAPPTQGTTTATKGSSVPPPSVDRRAEFNKMATTYSIDDASILWAINKAVSDGVVKDLHGDITTLDDADFLRACAGAEIVLKGLKA